MKAAVLIIDNYDSFTWNLVQLIAGLGAGVEVRRNNEITIADALGRRPTHILISPGPGAPKDAGLCGELVIAAAGKVALLGVCLGHQCIVEAFGGVVGRAREPVHGKASIIDHTGAGVFEGVPNGVGVGRYHSLIAKRETLPESLEVTAVCADEIMAVRHRRFAIEGVQFHPESILTSHGDRMLRNFLARSGGLWRQ